MDEVSLMDRTDTKFVFEFDKLFDLLGKVQPYYKALEINSNRFANYKTDYLDTLKFGMYTAHQNGKLNRFKVRFREYVGSNLSFLEVKFKNSKGKTIKSRIKSWVDHNVSIQEEEEKFLKTSTPFDINDLQKVLTNNFSRITLVSKTDKERLTIDFNLQFVNSEKDIELSNLVIAEVKQEKVNRTSKVMQVLKEMGIREASFSKYATGAAILYPHLKYNKFKQNILFLNKIHKTQFNGSI